MNNIQIGCGGYGAVFHPPLGSNDTNTVGKVVFSESTKEAKQEWLNIKAIRKIDPEQNYFLYPIKKEEIDVNEYNKYAKTPFVETGVRTLVQFTLNNGGMSLRKHRHLSLHSVLIHIIRVAHSIEIMLRNDIIHLDMHLGNMMSNYVEDVKIIDFGLSRNSKTFYSPSNFLWTTEYAVNPPEFRLVQTRRKKTNNLAIEQQILAQYLLVDESYLNHVYMNPLFIQSYEQLNSSIVGLRQSEKYSKKIALKYLQEMNSHETTDVYGLGVAIIEILTKNDFPEVSLETYMKLWDIITNMIMPHPKDRASIETVINELKNLLEHLETND